MSTGGPYPVSTMRRVREMSEGGWTHTEIGRVLEREGVDVPSRTTIIAWTNPRYEEQERVKSREQSARRSANRNRGRLAVGKRSDLFKQVRVRSLRTAGLSPLAISRVMTFDFPDDPMTERAVRKLLGERAPRKERVTT